MNGPPLLTTLTLLPLVGGIVVIGLAPGRKQLARRLGLGFSLAALALAMVLWARFDPAYQGGGSGPPLQFEERHAWIPALAVEYHLGIDGLGLLMVLLSAIVVPMALLAAVTATTFVRGPIRESYCSAGSSPVARSTSAHLTTTPARSAAWIHGRTLAS